jgi:hypothetical protein
MRSILTLFQPDAADYPIHTGDDSLSTLPGCQHLRFVQKAALRYARGSKVISQPPDKFVNSRHYNQPTRC